MPDAEPSTQQPAALGKVCTQELGSVLSGHHQGLTCAQALEEDVARLSRANASLAEDLQRARRRGTCNYCFGATFVRVTCQCVTIERAQEPVLCVLKFLRCLRGQAGRPAVPREGRFLEGEVRLRCSQRPLAAGTACRVAA